MQREAQPEATTEEQLETTTAEELEGIVNNHVLWAMGAGLIPVPLFDIAAVTAIQMDMLRQLARHCGSGFSESTGKQFLVGLTGSTFARIGASALTKSTFARIGASVFKFVPGVGSIIGGISMSALSGASTYAVGHVAINRFTAHDDLQSVDLAEVRKAYQEAFERGQRFVSTLKDKARPARDIYGAIQKLGELKEQGLITAEEFQVQKQKLLDRL